MCRIHSFAFFFCPSAHVYLSFFLFSSFRCSHGLFFFFSFFFGFLSVRSLSNPSTPVDSFLFFRQVFFLSWSRHRMWQYPFAPTPYIIFLKPIPFIARDSSSGFCRGISHFFMATRNTTEGVGEKEQYGLRSAPSARVILWQCIPCASED